MAFSALLALGVSSLAPAAAATETDLTTSPITAAADDGVTWTYTVGSSGDAAITGYTLPDGATQISIPETIDGHRVGAVAARVFAGDTRLVNVTFPSSVVSLGEYLFQGCTKLKHVDLTAVEELSEIPPYCFYGCTALESVDIPASVTRIMGCAFADCTSLNQVNIPPAGKLDRIGIMAFANCKSLQSLDFPAALRVIEMHAFDGCKSVASIRFRGTEISLINEYAFKGCIALEELYLPDHVDVINKQAFANCTWLKVVAYGKELPGTLASDVFSGCDAIEMMIFPMEKNDQGGYREISDSNKKQAGWKKGVTASVHIIYDDDDNAMIGAIHATSKHRTIALPAKIGYHKIVKIIEWAAKGETALTELVFPDDCLIATIEFDAFKDCTSLKSITIPASVTRIETGVFAGCTSLTDVTFNTTGLASLGGATFMGCTSLESIRLPEGMTTLYESEFLNCTKLKSVYLPDTMRNIGANAFGCGKGKHMAIETMRMPNSGPEGGDLHVPSDVDFFETWITNQARDTFQFEVTYGSTADYIWFEPHTTYDDPQHYPIVLPESDRKYVPVAIGDDDTHEQEVNDVKLQWDTVVNWTGEQIIPEVTATRWWRADPIGGSNLTVELVEGDDGTSVGDHRIKVTGNEPYFTGYRYLDYEIAKSNLDDVEMKPVTGCVWDNAKWEPDPEFYVDRSKYGFLQGAEGNGDGTYTLVRDRDYTIKEYKSNKMAGDATITIEGMGNFTGKKSFTFTIAPGDLGKTQVKVPDVVYTGEPVTAAPSEVMLVDRRPGDHYTVSLYLGTDYKVDPTGYKNNTNVGTATLKLIPADDCTWVTGSTEVDFKIVQADLSEATVELVPDQTYTGADITPALKVSSGEGELVQDRDYTVTWENNRNVGTASATLKAKSVGCKGEKTITFKIVRKPVTVTPNDADKTYGGADPALTATVEGTVGSDTVVYSLARDPGENAGMYEIRASGAVEQGNYAVTFKTGTFTIGPASITEATVAPIDSVTYDGAAFEPEPAVTWCGSTLVKDRDYTLEYTDNTNAGRATIRVQGIGNFKDEVDPHFSILPFDLRRDGCEVLAGYQVHTGSALEPHPKRVTAPGRDGTLVLEEDVDYKVRDDAWHDNVDVGTGYVRINGIGNFCESREGSFNIINDGDLSQGFIRDIDDQVYTGGPIEPALHVELTGVDLLLIRDIDYAAAFTGNVNAGTAQVIVTGIGEHGLKGSCSTTFTILPADLSGAVVAVPDQTFSGGPLKPAPTVTWNEMLLLEGENYEVVSYMDNVHAGTATVTVRGKGNFKGTATGTFDIEPADIASAAVAAEDRVYSGTAQTPIPTVSWNEMLLIEGKDYDVAGYADNVHAGEASVTVTGKGDFAGTASGTFVIARKQAAITVDSASKAQGEPDPVFTGTVDGLVDAGDIGVVRYVRTNGAEAAGTYKGVLDAEYAANADYDVSVTKGDFTIKEALVAIWLDGDGSVLQTKVYGEGDPVPAYDGKEPTKAATEQFTYAFIGWDGGTVEGTTTTFRPLFAETVNEYTVRFVNDDGTELQSGRVPYGEMPKYTGATPEKAATAQYTYTFAGWSPTIVPVAGDATYRATYTETAKKGTLTFDLGGGTIDGKTSLVIQADVGDVITIPEAPVREGYTFKYWKGSEYYPGDKYTVVGDHKFTAVWEKKQDGGGDSGGDGRSSPATGDGLGGAALAFVAAASLCVAAFALYRRRGMR